jgi:hypothetical protein
MPCVPGAQAAATAHRYSGSEAGMIDHMAGHMIGHLHGHDGLQATAPRHHHDDHGKSALDVCKCLNCGMCTTPGVAPPVRDVMPERRAILVSYGRATSEQPIAMTFVDPGIPIAIA